jgi:hypothetical protein
MQAGEQSMTTEENAGVTRYMGGYGGIAPQSGLLGPIRITHLGEYMYSHVGYSERYYIPTMGYPSKWGTPASSREKYHESCGAQKRKSEPKLKQQIGFWILNWDCGFWFWVLVVGFWVFLILGF